MVSNLEGGMATEEAVEEMIETGDREIECHFFDCSPCGEVKD